MTIFYHCAQGEGVAASVTLTSILSLEGEEGNGYQLVMPPSLRVR